MTRRPFQKGSFADAGRAKLTRGVVLVTVGLAACGSEANVSLGSPASVGDPLRVAVEVDNPAGTVRISPDPTGEVIPEFEFVEDFRLGTGPSEELFQNDYQTLSFLSDGSLVATGYWGDRLLLFSPSGEFVRQLAGPGRGPGELSSPTALGIAPDGSIWVANAFNRRYSKFDPKGEFVKTVPRPFGVVVQKQKRLVFRDGGTFIDQAAEIRGRMTPISFNVMDTLGNILETYPKLDVKPFQSRDIPRFGLGLGRAPDYYTFTAFGFDEDGVWFGQSDDLQIYRRDWSGDTTLVIIGDHRKDPELTREDRSVIDKSIRRAGLEWDDFYFSRPLLHGLYPLPNGGVLVQLTDRTYREDTPYFEIYSDSGQLVGAVEFPLPISVHAIPAFQGERIAVVATDSFDVPYVLVGSLRLRPTSESNAGGAYDFGGG